MKALSLWQPWASVIATGAKRIETRSWSTNYRGPLLIHAAKRRHVGELRGLGTCWYWRGALRMFSGASMFSLPFGAIVASCRLVDCQPSEYFTAVDIDAARSPDLPPGTPHPHWYTWTEGLLGDFGPGRFGWVLEDIRALPEPIPYRGRQRLFNVSDDVLREVA